MKIQPLAVDVFTLTLTLKEASSRFGSSPPLLFPSKVFLRERRLKRMIVFSDIIGHLRSSICSAWRAPSRTVASLIYMGVHGERDLNLKPGPVRSNHVNRSDILLPKLDKLSFSGPGFTRRLLYERGACERRRASGFDVLILSPLPACSTLD